MVKKGWWGVIFFAALAACNVLQATPGKPVPLADGGGGEGGMAGVCPSDLVVMSTDYMSTNVSALSPTGGLLSESIVSSGSVAPGLTAALSGDVVLPLASTDGTIVLIDRTNAVLTWVDPSTAMVLHQLNVGTGFAANPHDYVDVSATKAYVTRYESNMKAGQQPNDGGGDLLIIDPKAVTITGRIPFPNDGVFLPRADRMIRLGSEVWVSLERFDADFKTAGDTRLVGVSTATDAIAWTLDLPGVASCGGIAQAPSGKVVALSCTGLFSDADPKQRSAIVLLDATAHPPVELKRFAAASQLGAPLDSTLAYASEGLLVGVALGDAQAGRNDIAYTLDLSSGMAHMLADAGAPFAFGDVRCAPGCTDLCFLADAHAKALRIWKASDSSLTSQGLVPVDPTIGLAPRALGAF